MKHASFIFCPALAAGLLFLFSGIVTAQTVSPNALSIDAKAIYTPNGDVIVRWVPSNYKTWLWGRDSGFVLQRITLEGGDTILSPADMNASIVTISLTPKTQTEWETAILTDSVVGVAAGAYFGDGFSVTGPSSDSGIVAAYNLNSERDNRFGLALFAADISTLAAEMQNLYYKDESVEAGHKYAYLIRPRGNTGNNVVRPGNMTLLASNPYTAPVPVEFSVTPGDSVATLAWNQAATGEHYASYDIFRSADGGATFVKVNDQPITPMDHPNGEPADQIVYKSKLDNNSTQYQYKICGHSPFGFDGPSTSPIVVQGKPSPLKAPVSITTVNELASGGMEITWEFPEPLNNQIQGFRVLRDPNIEGTFAAIHPGILPVASRTYIDPDPNPTNYYKVEFVDLHDNKGASIAKLAQPKDSIAPAPPASVQGESVGKDGVLKLHWSPSTSSDVMGYRVFMADRPDGEFGQITTRWTKDTVFYHKANAWSLAEQKYFRVKAIDFRENSSEFSSLCAIALPDIVPPSQPVMKKTEPVADGVRVTFAPSKSHDIQAHRILRKKKDEVAWQEIALLDSLGQQNSVSFLDTTVENMHTYDYMVQAVDDADQKSNSKVFPVKPTGNGIRETVQGLEVRFVKSEEIIRLNWKYKNAYGISAFVIYRGTEANALYEVASVLPQQVLTGGAYAGPNPFAMGQPGNAPGAGITAPDSGQIAPASFNLQQSGSPNTAHDTFYEYRDKAFLRFKPYFFAVGVRYADGTSSPLSIVKSTSAY